MANVFRQNEISLFGTYFPIIGTVQSRTINTFAEKQVFGDISKDSGVVTSEWIIDDQRGGIGVREADEKIHNNRSWWSECYIEKGHILLPALVTSAGNPGNTAPEVTIEYRNEQYVAFGTNVYKWLDTINGWSSSLYTLPALPTDTIVYKDKLYFACGSDFVRFDGDTWILGLALTEASSAQPSRFFIEWDGKLLNLDNDGQLDYSVDEGVKWIANAPSDLAAGSYTSLFLYRDAAGNTIPYSGTKSGLYALKFDDAKWIETGVIFPKHQYAGMGANAWNDAAYIPMGLTVREYSTAASPAPVRLMGLDRDDGIPSDYRGNIIRIIPSHQEFFALLDATEIDASDHFPASAFNTYGNVQIQDNLGYSVIFRYNNRDAWSVVYKSGSTDKPVKCGAISTANGKYRLWFGMDGNMYYRALQVTIQHPLEIDDFEYGNVKEHITSRFNADNAVIRKTATLFTVSVNATSTEYIEFYYRIDGGSMWTQLTNSTFTDGKVITDGIHKFTFSSDSGLVFDDVQFRAVLTRSSSDTRVTPDLHWMRLSYLKESDVQWGFSLRINCSQNYRRKTAKVLDASLKAAADPGILGDFSFRKGNSTESHKVKILPPLQGVEIGGVKYESIYDVALIAP